MPDGSTHISRVDRDWVDLLPHVEKRATSRRMYERLNYVGSTYGETILVRAGYDGEDKRGAYSKCPTCHFRRYEALYGSTCSVCASEIAGDSLRERQRNQTGSTGLTASRPVNL